jgi:hypothetical protein
MPCGFCEDNAQAQIQDPPHIAKAINALDHSFGLCGAPAIPASPNILGKCRTKNHNKNIVPIRVASHCPIHFVAMLTPAAMKAQPKGNWRRGGDLSRNLPVEERYPQPWNSALDWLIKSGRFIFVIALVVQQLEGTAMHRPVAMRTSPVRYPSHWYAGTHGMTDTTSWPE